MPQKTTISSIDRMTKGQNGKSAPGVETLSVPVSGVTIEAADSGAAEGAGEAEPPLLAPVPSATGADAAPPGAAGAELALTLAAGLGTAAVGAVLGATTGAAVGAGATGVGDGGSGATDGFTAGLNETSEPPVPSM